MSRAFTIVVILALIAVVALVPRMGTDEPGLDLGDGYAYREDTLARFRLLLEDGGWSHADPPRNAQGMLEAVHAKTGLTFVLVPAGSFMMGAERRLERPVHRVRLGCFLLCETECTQRVWVSAGGENRSHYRRVAHPVEMVSWTECHVWCGSNGLRLPSEAEWEYACRAGTTTTFSTGGGITTDQANFNGRYSREEEVRGVYRERTVAAASLPPNPWGLHEMHGNVSEWCEDVWHDDYRGAPVDGSAWTTGGKGPFTRVFRGEGWDVPEQLCRSSGRFYTGRIVHSKHRGFRPAADLPAPEQPDD